VQFASTNSDSAANPDQADAALRHQAAVEPGLVEPNVDEAVATDTAEAEPVFVAPPWLGRWLWIAVCAAVILAGAVIRLYHLELVPLHHDEGVNGFFLTNLYRDHVYHYDPENYHGPTLYYFALVMTYIFGLSTVAIRLTTALFGIGTIWIILALRQRIGKIGAISAAAFVAFSPGCVYFSRYFIHETLFAFFTLGIIVYWFKYKDDPWPGYLMVAAVMAALLFATKETAVINAFGIVLAAIGGGIYIRLRNWITNRRGAPVEGLQAERDQTGMINKGRPPDSKSEAPTNERGRRRQILIWAGAFVLFAFVFALMYSSIFTYARGVKDAFRALSFWTKTGKTGHVHAWYSYVQWMWEEETPLLVLGGVGIITALWLATSRFAVFISLLTLAMLIGYSMVPYKTPWLHLTVMLTLAVCAGWAIQAFYERSKGWEKVLCVALIIAPTGFLLRQAIELNFYHYDDDNFAYVYAHTRREIFGLLDQVAEIARRSGKGDDLSITITTTEYWPLPWYFRNYKNAGFYGQLVNRGDLVVIGQSEQDADLQKMLGNSYIQLGMYTLRPGVDLVIYAKHDIEVQAPAQQ